MTDAPADAPVDLADGTTDTAPDPGGVPTTLNGCELAAAEDLTGQAEVTVLFGGTTGFAYSPKCFRVATGTQVTFAGSFGFYCGVHHASGMAGAVWVE